MPIPAGKSKPPHSHRRRNRSATGYLIIALGVGALLLALELHEDSRGGDDPALKSLLRAQSHLAQSCGPEQDLLSQSQAAHRELRATIELLGAAERADPATTKRIEELRTSLEAMVAKHDFEGMTPEELQAEYLKLRTELNALINGHLERSP